MGEQPYRHDESRNSQNIGLAHGNPNKRHGTKRQQSLQCWLVTRSTLPNSLPYMQKPGMKLLCLREEGPVSQY